MAFQIHDPRYITGKTKFIGLNFLGVQDLNLENGKIDGHFVRGTARFPKQNVAIELFFPDVSSLNGSITLFEMTGDHDRVPVATGNCTSIITAPLMANNEQAFASVFDRAKWTPACWIALADGTVAKFNFYLGNRSMKIEPLDDRIWTSEKKTIRLPLPAPPTKRKVEISFSNFGYPKGHAQAGSVLGGERWYTDQERQWLSGIIHFWELAPDKKIPEGTAHALCSYELKYKAKQ